MPSIDFESYGDDGADVISGKRIERRNRRLTQREKRIRLVADLIEHTDKAPEELQANFSPSFQPTGHEHFWLVNYLEEFYNYQWITDILEKVKGGKEATVYCCKAHPATGLDLVAAKVYRPQMFRSLSNDARYRQGRETSTHSRREALAIKKNTRFGHELRHTSWLDAEYETLQILHAAGADVPKPLAKGSNVILMEYLGERSAPAPSLNHVALDPTEAQDLFDRLVNNLAIMLSCHRVHADFSAYNVLYWEGQCTIIDFPQAVDPRRNPDAADLFVRDVERLCQYFRRYHVVADAHALADSLWGPYQF